MTLTDWALWLSYDVSNLHKYWLRGRASFAAKAQKLRRHW